MIAAVQPHVWFALFVVVVFFLALILGVCRAAERGDREYGLRLLERELTRDTPLATRKDRLP